VSMSMNVDDTFEFVAEQRRLHGVSGVQRGWRVMQRSKSDASSWVWTFEERFVDYLEFCGTFVGASWYDGNDDMRVVCEGGRDFEVMRRERVGIGRPGIGGKMFESPWRRR